MVKDIFTKETIEFLIENDFDRYLKLMVDADIPQKNKITLIYLKLKDAEKTALDKILKEATARREKLNDKY